MTSEQLALALDFLGWSQRELGRRSTGKSPNGRSHKSIRQYLDGVSKIPPDVEGAVIKGLRDAVEPKVLPDELAVLLSKAQPCQDM